MDKCSPQSLRLILEAGGNPDPKIPRGVFRSSPLTVAASYRSPEMLKYLLQFDVDPNAYNPEGYTTLYMAAQTSSPDRALVLLEFGADLNAVFKNGLTPLTTAIINNNHGVLQLFVDRCYEYITVARLKGAHESALNYSLLSTKNARVNSNTSK